MYQVSHRFTKVHLDDHEVEIAKVVSPYFWAYLQNKVADYAMAVIEISYDGKEGKELQATILEHERLKAQVIVLEELMMELTAPVVSTDTPASED